MGFSRFNLSPSIFQAITALGYAEPTPVQARVIPEAMKGVDVRASAQTGTGKTCAFVLPLLEKLIRAPRTQNPRGLILTPTRELAAQVMSVVQGLAKHTGIRAGLIVGGENFTRQARLVRSGVEILVATPGRLLDHLQQRTVILSDVHTLILDEADRMLDMGFLPSIRTIVSAVPPRRQTLLFSATYGPEIQRVVAAFQRNPIVIELATSAPSANVTHILYPVARAQKVALLQALLELDGMTSALIFTRTKHGANKLAETLHRMGKSVGVIHGNKSQSQRQAALQAFKDRRTSLLVATDIAARGIDVKNISHVINFDVPVSPEDYVHRIGRTGRAEAVGEAFTLVSAAEEADIRAIERLIGKTISRAVIPDFPYQKEPAVFGPSGGQQQHGRPSHGRPHHHQPHRGGAGRSSKGRPAQTHGRPSQNRFSQNPNQPQRHPNDRRPHNRPPHPHSPRRGK